MLSKEFCRRIGWFKPDGGLKDMMARVAMLAMHRDCLIPLPAPQGRQNRPGADRLRAGHRSAAVPGPGRPSTRSPARTCAPSCAAPGEQALERVRRPLPLSRIQDPGRRQDALRRPRPRRLAARHARLLHRRVEARPAATTSSDGHGNCARRTFPFVVDNPRFLILPWINIPNLGSHILAIIRRRLPDDWTERYNTTPVLIETFVETPRYTGAVYRASGWTRVGRVWIWYENLSHLFSAVLCRDETAENGYS